jgi:hypothetical protein
MNIEVKDRVKYLGTTIGNNTADTLRFTVEDVASRIEN